MAKYLEHIEEAARLSAGYYGYAQVARKLYDEARTVASKAYHGRTIEKAMRLSAKYARLAREMRMELINR